ncbi:SDR family NAD(P)-dependent oxidoreductase [Nocardia mexicana]|uniref:3-oxoacyl-[acyl-carrier protein] reductase n=1 Tax=Nocardia mexicana TaxID=279262 RepID=A0A370HFB4_9NOCA|nr:SDR family oxidoreductase [Nocardia mexicana]RDI55934.1 3-oxoacyl-[acyl-carrier protein] reductase [Nocardia mexicana]
MRYSNIDRKVVVVTGAAQGIGAGYAQRLHREGATVAAVDLSPAVQELADCTSHHIVDVADPDSCRTLAAELGERYGRVDGVINNAAIFSTIRMKPFWEITPAEWDRLMAVNLKGPWLLTATLLPLLRRSDGASIVNIGSDAVQLGRSGYLHYVASKGGVTAMTFSMSHELGQYGIRVNTLSPGPVYTEVARETVSPEQKDAMLAAQALHRTAGPDDMTSLAVFLLSDDSSYLTGQTISVNGGLVHR